MQQQSKFAAGSLIAILFAAILLHVIGLKQPYLGNFAQHQTDYATVAQRWVETSIQPFAPAMRFLANGTNRLFYGDFPLNMTLAASLSRYFGLTLELSGRGLSAFFFFLSLLPFVGLCKLIFDNQRATFYSFLFYLLSPLTIIYSQAFLLEITALNFGITGYFFFFLWQKKDPRVRNLIIAGVFFSLMLTTRIYFAPALIPLGLIFFYQKGPKALAAPKLWAFVVLSIILPVLWQYYASHASSANNEESSLVDNFRVFVTSDPVLASNRYSFKYYLPILDTIMQKIVTPVGLVIAIAGVFLSPKSLRLKLFTSVFLLSFVPLFIFAPRKFVEFEYYFLPFVPMAAICAGAGLSEISERFQETKFLSVILLAITLALGFRYSIAPLLIIPNEDRYVRELGRKVQEAAKPGDRVIASHGSSTSLLYYTHRDGWAFSTHKSKGVRNQEDSAGTPVERVERFKSQGAKYFACSAHCLEISDQDFLRYLDSEYAVQSKGIEGIVYALEKKAGGQQ